MTHVSSDSTKFAHIVSVMDDRTVEVIRDILMKPPTTNRYEMVNRELIRRLASSREQRIK